MDGIREYLLRVTVAALCCGIIISITGSKGMTGVTIKFLSGIFMAIIVVSPLNGLRLDALTDMLDDIHLEADQAAAFGEDAAREDCADIIKENVTAYILDKAGSSAAALRVEVTLDDSVPPVPCSVKIQGRIAPYEKSLLSDAIEKDLGIKAEDQKWTG